MIHRYFHTARRLFETVLQIHNNRFCSSSSSSGGALALVQLLLLEKYFMYVQLALPEQLVAHAVVARVHKHPERASGGRKLVAARSA